MGISRLQSARVADINISLQQILVWELKARDTFSDHPSHGKYHPQSLEGSENWRQVGNW